MIEEGDARRREVKPAVSSTTTAATTTSWSKLKDPRIVRVSRAFGGKDRHSKVFTVRGLRDRRVRLSVQTAIQLYDLQDRLGFNQPSKVVDWLLNAAKHEIDELPPLPFPQGGFFEQQQLVNHEMMGGGANHSDNLASFQSSVSGVSINPFMRWDPSNLTLSYPPRSFELGSGNEELHALSWQNHLHSSIPSGSNQITTALPYFQFDSKHFNFQGDSEMGAASSPTVRPFNFNMTANLLPCQRNNRSSE